VGGGEGVRGAGRSCGQQLPSAVLYVLLPTHHNNHEDRRHVQRMQPKDPHTRARHRTCRYPSALAARGRVLLRSLPAAPAPG